jgi:HK97 family phage major capsid protein
MTLEEMAAQRAKLMDELRALSTTGKERDLTEKEEARFTEIEKEVAALDTGRDKLEARKLTVDALEAAEREPATTAEREPLASGAGEDRSAGIVVGKNHEEDHPFKTFGEYLRSIAAVEGPAHFVDPRLRPLEVRAGTGLQEGVPSDGGFLVQQDFSTELLKRTYEVGEIMSRVRKIPISPASSGLKVNAIDETSRAAGSRFGGIRGYWAAEGGVKAASNPRFRQIELNLHKLIGLCYATDELLADTVALEAVIKEGFAEETNFLVEDAIIEGTGAGMPAGIMGSGALVTVTKETGQLASTIRYPNLCKMWSRMWARSRRTAVWLINQDVEPELFNMGIVVGTGGSPVYVPPGGASASPYSSLFGRPVIPVEYCATLGTTGDLLLADLTQYLMIDKGGQQTAYSIHVRFVYDEGVYRFVYRVDGSPIWKSALTPFRGTQTVSPFVVLETRA